MSDAKYQLKIEKEKTNQLILKDTLENPVLVFAALYLLTDQLVAHGYMRNDSGKVLVMSAGAITLASTLTPALPAMADAGSALAKGLVGLLPPISSLAALPQV